MLVVLPAHYQTHRWVKCVMNSAFQNACFFKPYLGGKSYKTEDCDRIINLRVARSFISNHLRTQQLWQATSDLSLLHQRRASREERPPVHAQSDQRRTLGPHNPLWLLGNVKNLLEKHVFYVFKSFSCFSFFLNVASARGTIISLIKNTYEGTIKQTLVIVLTCAWF